MMTKQYLGEFARRLMEAQSYNLVVPAYMDGRRKIERRMAELCAICQMSHDELIEKIGAPPAYDPAAAYAAKLHDKYADALRPLAQYLGMVDATIEQYRKTGTFANEAGDLQ